MKAKRTDKNHSLIADAYEKLGCRVHRTNADWDLTVQYGGLTDLVEIKNPETAYGKRGENDRQKQLPVMRRLIRTVDDVAEHVAVLRKRHALIVHYSALP